MSRRLRIIGIAVSLVVAMVVVVGSPTSSSADQNEGSTAALVDAQRLVAVGGLHTCAVMDEGSVRCWGDNANGQLGNGTQAVSTEPRPVSGIGEAVAVTAGNAHSCALLQDSTVSCWGLNSNGQIGADPVALNEGLVPNPVPGLRGVRAIAAGGFHNCALLVDGHVRCWGLDGIGQIGDGAGTPSGDAPVPVPVVGLSDATAIAAGEFHTCAIRATGAVACWGHNGFGQLGDGTDDDRTAPVAVSGLPDGTKKALAVTAGYGHTCVVVDDGDADVAENTIRCWGNNTQGQLGDGTSTDRSTPTTVKIDDDPSPLVYDHVDFTGADVVTAGQYHTCARRITGSAWCWGNAGRGQVGDGTRGDPMLPDEEKGKWRSARAVAIPAVSALAAGGFHSCALVGTSMRCWGYNFYGQLGSFQAGTGAPVTVTALQGAASVATGTDAACARVLVPATPDRHRAVCWGTNAHGELGAGLPMTPSSSSTVPVDVVGQPDVSAITAGNRFACALPTGSSSPVCWGDGDDGQLGNGGTTDVAAPVPVSGLTTASQLSAGGRNVGMEVGHACARRSDGTAECWGANDDGQLGDGSAAGPPPQRSSVPVTVRYDADPEPGPDHVDLQPLPDVVQVAAGGTHSCALRTDTSVWCWGRNLNGQIGDNTMTERRYAVPVKLTDEPDDDPPDTYLLDVLAVTAGERHTCVLRESRFIRCWGANDAGQLGDGTTVDRHLPTLVVDIPRAGAAEARNDLASAVTAGTSHTCAILENASARCWGDDSAGQLGDGGVGGFSTRPVTPVGLDNDTADTIRTKLAGTGEPDDLVTSLSAGRRNTCASLIDRTVSCWGSNSDGQLGDGVGPTRLTPITVEHLDQGINGNRSPVAVDDAGATTEDTPVDITVTTNDADPDGDPIAVRTVGDPPHGSASGSGAKVTYTPDPDHCGPDTVHYRISDGRNGVADAFVTVTIACVNDAPVAAADEVTTDEDQAVVVPVLANDTDPDAGDVLVVASATGASHGTLEVVAGGVTYTPAPNFTGSDSFTYVVEDGDGWTDTSLVTVQVEPGNDPPVATDDDATTGEDSPVVVPVLGNDTDVDADTLLIASVSQPGHGTAVVEAGGVRYTPAPDFTGGDSFTYVVSDGHEGTDTGTVTLTVSAVNDGPVAVDDSIGTTQDQVVTVDVLANDTDPDGDTLAIQSITQPSHGTTVIEAGGVKYTPAAGYSGQDSFTYVATDSTGATDGAFVSIAIGPADHPPFAGDDLGSTSEDTPVTLPVLANDYDPEGVALTITSVSSPAHGTATVVAGGIRYEPAPDFWGSDTFTYVISDGTTTDTAAVSMTVTGVADPPQAADDAVGTPEDTPATFAVTGNDSDGDGDAVTVTGVSVPAHGTAAVVAGGVRYTPAGNYAGPDSFTYTVSDGKGGTDSATVQVTVTGVNDAPTLEPVADRSIPWGSLVSVALVGADVDSGSLGYSLVSGPAGVAVDGASGQLTWTPAAGDVGLRTVIVRVSDGSAAADRSFKVSVTRQATTLVYTGATSGQHSDPVGVAATVTAAGGAPVPGVSVGFDVAGVSASATTGSGGSVSMAVVLTATPGASAVTASFGGTPAYEPSSAMTPFTVVPEAATVAVAGPGLVLTSGTASTAAATLRATVLEEADGALGTSLSAASVQFVDQRTGTVLCTGGVVVGSPSSGAGTAGCTTAALPVSSRAVIARLVSASYAAPVDVGALTVASTAVSGSAVGGGSVVDSAFGFRAAPGKKGAPPSGEVLQVYRQVADLGGGGGARPYAFVVSSSSLSSLSTACTGKATKVCSAVVQAGGASTVAVDVASGAVLPVPGVSTLRVDATDHAEPAAGSVPGDRYAGAVSGPRPFAVGGPGDQRLLVSGNIRIPA